MLEWKKIELKDRDAFYNAANKSNAFGCDENFVTLFLYEDISQTMIAYYKEFIFIYYPSYYDLKGYGFPLGCGDLKQALEVLKQDATDNNRCFNFILLTQMQCEALMQNCDESFNFRLHRELSDYVYLQEDLATLKGKKYQKKRNHISHFLKQYPNVRIEMVTENNTKDALKVAYAWDSENMEESLHGEQAGMEVAFANYQALQFKGMILYIDDLPVAMTIGSYTSDNVFDVHFEKAIGEYANQGAYTYINQQFASTIHATYLNREEDIDIDGLRKAKLSYHPSILLDKYCAELK